MRPQLNEIKINKEHKFKRLYPEISVYTYVWRPLANGYPVEECLRSWAWADEIIVVNAAEDSEDDGTKALLARLQEEIGPKLVVWPIPCSPKSNHLFDGENKNTARALTSSKFVISADIDELCCGAEQDWRELAKEMPDDVDGYNLPVHEVIGAPDQFRTSPSFNPWKWRLSRNKPEFGHGLPQADAIQVDGKTYSKGGSDGAFYVHVATKNVLAFHFPLVDEKPWFSERLISLRDSNPEEYQRRMEHVFTRLPHVHHVGHLDLKRKIKLYLETWHSHWNRLYGRDENDPKNNKYFPGVLPVDVTEEMIDAKVAELLGAEKTLTIEPRVRIG